MGKLVTCAKPEVAETPLVKGRPLLVIELVKLILYALIVDADTLPTVVKPDTSKLLETVAFPESVVVPATPRLPVLEELPRLVSPETVKFVSDPVTPPSVPGVGGVGGMLIGMSG